jgi:hypothetical protein
VELRSARDHDASKADARASPFQASPAGTLESSGITAEPAERSLKVPAGEIREPPFAFNAKAGSRPRIGLQIDASQKTAGAAPLSEPRPDWETGVPTHAGGVLYLIHVLRQLGLMRYFDAGLSGWCVLELVARCLMFDFFASVAADPIWAALAELDRRDHGTPAVADFQPQAPYTAPDSWSRNLGEEQCLARYRARGYEV